MTQTREQLYAATEEISEKAARSYAKRHGSLNGMTVEDYHQAARIGIWNKLPQFDARQSALESWAARTAHNAIRDEVRKCDEVGRSRRADGITGAMLSLEVGGEAGARGRHGEGRKTLLRDLIAAPRSIDRVAAFEALDERLAGLDERQRVVVFLLDAQDLSESEAGAVLDLPDTFIAEIHAEALAILRGTRRSTQRRRGTENRSRKAKKRTIIFSQAAGQFGPLFTEGTYEPQALARGPERSRT
jgi:RNA polymerase sigma factor (sigma-70 family)